ncbi:MAG TPA: acetylglutamate kinase [Treponemataceae bacterium]|nr:acetylglutamate kinase [Treponemataceae bacterium]
MSERLSNQDWAEILMQALPYMKQYVGKTIVVKYGGNAMLNEDLKKAVMDDIVLLSTIGIHTVLVHGGGPEINAMLEKTGKESKFINGLRYTDGETMEIVQMVLTGKLNKDIVGLLLQAGGKAVGLSGVDAGLLRAKKIDKDGVDLGFVGDVTEVNPGIIQALLAQGYIPVVSTVAIGEQGDMNRYNINADTAAAKIAVALKAEKFVQLTNVPGLLRDLNDPSSLISKLNHKDIAKLVETGVISSGMIPKIECNLEAIEGGVPRTYIIDGRVPHALLIEMFSDRGIGTMID